MAAKDVRYRVRNWAAYNASLRQRGSLTIWVDEESLTRWYAAPSGKVGQPSLYSDVAIRMALTLRTVYRLALRQTEGFLASVFSMMGIDVDIPDYSTLCRRAKSLNISLDNLASGEPMHLVIDSTGLKIFGEGEWKVRMHSIGKRRTWRKLHVGVDFETREVVAAAVTEANVHDSTVVNQMAPESGEKAQAIYADGAYDNLHGYGFAAKIGVKAFIDPRSGAALATGKNITPGQKIRNENIIEIWKSGKDAWKDSVGYHKRSIVENTMFRTKTIFGERMSSRKIETQKTEGRLRMRVLNRMTKLGMPISEKVFI
jgi:IS5 family transposase